MLVTVIALDVRQTLDVGEPTARACLAGEESEIGDIEATTLEVCGGFIDDAIVVDPIIVWAPGVIM